MRELLTGKINQDQLTELVRLLSEGALNNDHPITYDAAKAFGLPVSSEMPSESSISWASIRSRWRQHPAVDTFPTRGASKAPLGNEKRHTNERTRNMQPWQEIRRTQREVERLFSGLAPAWRWPLTGEVSAPRSGPRNENGLALSALCSRREPPRLSTSRSRPERRHDPGASPSRKRMCPRRVYHRREWPVGTFFARTVNLGERSIPSAPPQPTQNGILESNWAAGRIRREELAIQS